MADTRISRRACLTVAAVIAVLSSGAAAAPADSGSAPGGGRGLKLVGEVAFSGGTHLELTRIGGRDYAFMSQLVGDGGNLRVVDVTFPERPRPVASVPCTGFQGNVQVSHDKKTLLLGFDAVSDSPCMPAGTQGFATIDISNPRRPRPIGYAQIERGSHSLAAHPTKPYVYNGDGFPEAPGEMQVWSIRNPRRPKLVGTLDTGIHSPHDLAFNKKGTMAATANAVNIHLLDTRRVRKPRILYTTQCPGCVHTHEARFLPSDKGLVVNDEHPAAVCPGGAMYFYDIVKEGKGRSLTLTGAYTAGDVGVNSQADVDLLCTPHVFDISNDGTKVAASWHAAGVKYLDISHMAGAAAGATTVGDSSPRELGWYANKGGDAFTAKMHRGPYIYVVDARFGFQVFRAHPAR